MAAMAATELMLRDPSLTLSTAQQKHISAVPEAVAAALVQTAETLRRIIKVITRVYLLLYRSEAVAAATAEKAAMAATTHLFYQVIPAAEAAAAATAYPATVETDTPEAALLFSTAV